MDILSTALGGIQSSQASTLGSAQRLASLPAEGTAAVSAATDRVDISKEAMNLALQEKVTGANAAVIRTADQMQKHLIDLFG